MLLLQGRPSGPGLWCSQAILGNLALRWFLRKVRQGFIRNSSPTDNKAGMRESAWRKATRGHPHSAQIILREVLRGAGDLCMVDS
jgi:hypothetical protein